MVKPYTQERTFKIDIWTFEKIAKGLWKIYPTAGYIIATGAVYDAIQLPVSFPHRLLRWSIFHTDSAFAASSNAMSFLLNRKVKTTSPANFEEYLIEEDMFIQSWRTELFGECFDYEPCIYTFSFYATTTHCIFPVWYIQKLED